MVARAQRPEVLRSGPPLEVRVIGMVVDLDGLDGLAPLVLASMAVADTNLAQDRLRGKAPDDAGLTSAVAVRRLLEGSELRSGG